jgi:putative phosphoribosyl transferase
MAMAVPSRETRKQPAPTEQVVLESRGLRLEGLLEVPEGARGVVLFAHGSGSSRMSPRNRFVAQELREAGIGTLLFDLLSPTEGLETANVFDVDLLAARLRRATDWVSARPEAQGLALGYFGASTGAAAALAAAAAGAPVQAVVSRGGRPDLAAKVLDQVRAPTLLIVGGHDEWVLELNREALALLRCEKDLRVVPGATHLFEEAGALEQVVVAARDWFLRHLRPTG